MISALSLAGFLEGIGIMALLPLIAVLTGQAGVAGGTVTAMATGLFDTLGIAPTVPHILLFIVGVMVAKAALGFLAVMQVAYASSHVMADLRLEYIRSLIFARWLHLVGIQTGTIASAVGVEAQRSAVAFKQGCQALAYIVQIVVYAMLVLLVSWRLTLAAMIAGGMLVVILGFLTRIARRAGTELTSANDRVLSLITDTFFGAKPLKAMGKGHHLLGLVERDIRSLQSAQRRLDMTDQSIPVLSEPLMVVFVALGLFGALTYSNLPLTELLFMAVVFLRMTMRIASAQRAYQSMAANESALWSLRKKIDSATAVAEDFSGRAPADLHRSIDIEGLSYSYGERNILENLNMHIPARGLHVIFGPSGTGKTTLIDLITGLLQPDEGSIKVDGINLADIDRKSWKCRIGYVPQDVLLFHDTLYNNVTLGDESLSRADAEAALAQAGAHGFVQQMDGGIDEIVGERGAKLSGGQRQRIAIARALVHKPQLLILDEATSALDPATEKEILQTVKNLAAEMTVLAVSHNPALTEIADTVWRMENGCIGTETQQDEKVVI